ncbi:MAG: hypothetical protein NTX45_12270 [Proteobacteria bacterium]|nr:hypothetical protein [Pseudomonadota bacterium]
MISNTQQSEKEKINELAEQYALEGYSVTREPSEFDLPFDLDGYRPDLVATKENSGLIVEVKAKLARLPVERFREIAEEVSRHPGWRFLLVTLDDVESQNPPGTSDDMPNWTQLREHATQASGLLREGRKEPALLFLWSIFEALLRKRAIEMSIPIERFPVKRLINHMYSMGELALSQYDLTNSVLESRNKLAHGFLTRLDEGFMNQFNTLIMTLIDDWGHSD